MDVLMKSHRRGQQTGIRIWYGIEPFIAAPDDCWVPSFLGGMLSGTPSLSAVYSRRKTASPTLPMVRSFLSTIFLTNEKESWRTSSREMNLSLYLRSSRICGESGALFDSLQLECTQLGKFCVKTYRVLLRLLIYCTEWTTDDVIVVYGRERIVSVIVRNFRVIHGVVLKDGFECELDEVWSALNGKGLCLIRPRGKCSS